VPSIQVGNLTLFINDGYDLGSGAHEELEELLLQLQVASAEVAYRDGNREGLVTALQLLNRHRPSEAPPAWVMAGVLVELDRQPAINRRGGRHARERTRRRDDAVDAARSRIIDGYMNRDGLSLNAARKRASERLRDAVGGSEDVMKQAYQRFQKRVSVDPSRYYPFLGPILHLMLKLLPGAESAPA
jgi:hypothetical protein